MRIVVGSPVRRKAAVGVTVGMVGVSLDFDVGRIDAAAGDMVEGFGAIVLLEENVGGIVFICAVGALRDGAFVSG